MLHHLAQLVASKGYGRLEWSVLDWNTPAITFYKSLGAAPLDDWTMFRLTGEALNSISFVGVACGAFGLCLFACGVLARWLFGDVW